MGIVRVVTGAVIALGVVSVGYVSLDRQDTTTRDADGETLGAGQLSALTIDVGDCLELALNQEIETLAGIPCSTPHDAEVYHAFELRADEYPGRSALAETAQGGCDQAFEPFVGLSAGQTSIYDVSFLHPSLESWNDLDNREIFCLMRTYDGAKKTGTARNSGI